MRFDKRIIFVNITESYYDTIEGEYVEGKEIETKKPCNLSTLGVQRTNELFVQIDKLITIAKLQHHHNGKIDYVKLNDREQKYNVKRQSDYRKGVFYLESVQT